jgi:CRP-like cAMP-binding protein
MGNKIVVKDGYLCRRNQVQSELLLILDGSVAVKKNGVRLAELSRGNFVAEMSFMTGEPATADVQCIDSVALVSWSQAKIHNLNHINDALLMKIQVIMGKAMSKKIEKRRVTRDLKRG